MAVCSVVTAACAAPAGYLVSGLGYANGRSVRLPRCYGCGEPVCANCSTRVGRSRICFNCQLQNVSHLI